MYVGDGWPSLCLVMKALLTLGLPPRPPWRTPDDHAGVHRAGDPQGPRLRARGQRGTWVGGNLSMRRPTLALAPASWHLACPACTLRTTPGEPAATFGWLVWGCECALSCAWGPDDYLRLLLHPCPPPRPAAFALNLSTTAVQLERRRPVLQVHRAVLVN